MLNIRKFLEGIGIVPKSSSTADTQGELEVLSSDGKLRYHNGTSVSPVVTEAHSATLTNKTIDADSNTITNIENADIKAGAAIDASKIADGSVSSTEFQYLANVTSDIQTQLNSKSSATLTQDHILVGNASNVATGVDTTAVGDIEADATNGLTIKAGAIVNADINASAAIDASKIADGSVSNAEFQYLANVTSDIQTQLNNTVTASSTNTLTNKTIDGDNNTVQDLALTSLKTNLTDANKFLVRDGSGIVVSNTKDVPTGVVVGTTDTQTLTNKTLTTPSTDIVTWDDQASTPSNPAAGFYKTYFKTDGKLYKLDSSGIETEVGSGGPGFTAGLNLMLLNTAANNWAADKTNNFNAEVSVGDWAAYADAAGTAPVDMTGGSPNTTISRTTTNEINGVASFEMAISSGATRQGEGVSCLVNIPTAYRGKTLTFKFPYTLTGTVTEDDLRLYAYDVTNSVVLTPYTSGKILGASGMAQCSIDVASTAAQIRVGIHIARASNTGAVTLQFDDVVLSLDSTPTGLAGSDWRSDLDFTLSAGFGTTSGKQIWYKREGDSMRVRGNFTWGTGAASTVYIQMPSGYTIDTAKMPTTSNGTFVGKAHGTDLSGAQIESSGVGHVLFYDGSTNNQIFLCRAAGTTTTYLKQNGNAFGSNSIESFEFLVPISGWSANVTMAESSSFLISSYLANGTRVTGTAPTRLGEYRSYLRNANANTFTETNGSPTTIPSSSNGILIYDGNAYTSADTNNEPTRYEIFVGKNKQVFWEFYKNTGRTGFVDTTPGALDGGRDTGYLKSYDPITGIATISAIRWSTGGVDHQSGIDETGGTAVNDIYFDIKVSENALAVGVQNPRSEVIVNTGNGHGSTNNKIRRFTTTEKSIGTAITYADSSTDGASFTINESGVYAVTYSDKRAGTDFFGISINSNQLTTSINDITSANRKAICLSQNSEVNTCSTTFICSVGDIIRPHTAGTMDDTTGRVKFAIVKVSN